nr:AMP-binding protein [Pseudomonadota bacterium]
MFETFPQNAANHTPLSPLSFIKRAALMFPDHPAVIYGKRRYTWAETYKRTVQLATAITNHGLGKGDTVAILSANTPEMVEAHFGVAMAGAVLNSINTRLEPETIAYILEHGEAKMLI